MSERAKRGAGFAVQMGASPISERKDDFYETPECATLALLRHEDLPHRLWEPACGKGAISRVLLAKGHTVMSSDLVDRGFGNPGWDFLMESVAPTGFECIVTNPPFKLADEFVRHGLRLVPKVVMLLRLAYLEGAGRADVHRHCHRIWLGRERLPFMHREGWTGPVHSNSAAPFAWFVFEREHASAIELRHISWREPSHAV